MRRDVASLILFALVLQNSGITLLAKYSFRDGAKKYNTSTVVACSEVLKLTCSFLIELALKGFSQEAFCKTATLTKSRFALFVPALLYVGSSNLQLIALKGLSPSVFVVVSQLKILATALFSVVLLRTRLTKRKLLAVLLLTMGVAVVQLRPDSHDNTSLSFFQQYFEISTGLLFVAVILSSLAGVLLEKFYKDEEDTMWVKNFYMSCFSLPFALGAVFFFETPDIFRGFNLIVYVIVFLQALGGLIVGAVLKFADNIVKCFAVALSILVCTCASSAFGEKLLSFHIVGGTIVVFSVYMYSAKPPEAGGEVPKVARV